MKGRDLRIVYMGTPDFAVMPLRLLVEGGYNVVAVVTMPDKPAGRGLKMQESAVKKYALEAGLKVLQPEKLKAPEFVEEFASLKADLGIVIAFRMLPDVIWTQPVHGTFNLHASLLPQYRGAAPINHAIINGEQETGVTTFLLNHEIDKGAIIGQSHVAIEVDDDAGTLHDKLMYAGADLVLETVESIAKGDIKPMDQNSIDVGDLKSAPKIFKEDCRVDWSKDGRTIRNLVRGLSPYPAAWSEFHAGDGRTLTVKIFSVRAESAAHGTPIGKVISDGKKVLKITCADGYVHVDELQPAGKKRMKTEEWLRGFKDIAYYGFAVSE